MLPNIVYTESADGAKLAWGLLPDFDPSVPIQYCADGDGMFVVILLQPGETDDFEDRPAVDAPTWYVRTDCSGYLMPLSAANGIDAMLTSAHEVMRNEDPALFDAIRIDVHAPGNYPAAPATVREACSSGWIDITMPEVLDCPVTSEVGAESLGVMRAADALIALLPDAHKHHNAIRAAAAHQCRIFYTA